MGAVHSVLGRERELTLLSEFLRAGVGAPAVVLTGGPGIGKTTIWEAGVDDRPPVRLSRPARPLAAAPTQASHSPG